MAFEHFYTFAYFSSSNPHTHVYYEGIERAMGIADMMTRDQAEKATSTEIKARLREIKAQIASLSEVQASAKNSATSEHGRMRADSITILGWERGWLNRELKTRTTSRDALPVAA
jgi:hypothetical protein